MNIWRKQNFNILDLQNQVSTIYFDLTNTDYKYIEKIGTGTYGIVCQAEHIQTKQYYAIKKIKNPFNHKVTLIRTLREIRILNHFNHANIINIVDIFLKDSNNSKDIYVVFDLMESDLHKIITSKQMLSDDHIRYFMYQLICGVNYIHSASVIHRDLKPANILINSNCHLKIADFGMARLLITVTKCDTSFPDNVASLNMTQYVMTRWYRAPELIMGQISYDTKIDLWSCGCILAELYLKEPLFRGDNMINQLKEIIRKMGTPESQFRAKVLPIVNSLINAEGHLKPIPLNNLIKNAPKKVIDLLSHLLVYDPDQRWSASQTLKHIFFLKYKNPSKEEICKSTLDLSFEIKLNSIDLLKDALLGDISSINSKQINFNLMTHTNFSKEIDDYSRKPILSSCEIQSLNRSESPISQRTLSADSGKELGYPIMFFELENSSSSSLSTNNIYKDNRLKTVSQFTKNKLINSIQKPKNKSKKIITAAQRQKERQDRKLKLKHKRDENFHINKVITKCLEPLSDLDKSYLKKWEHLTKSTVNVNEKNIDQESYKNCYENTSIIKNTKYQANEVDEMSAGLSALLLLDDIIENDQNITTRALNFNSNQNENISSDNLDLLFDVDIDCIDLDLSILESYSDDLLKE